MKITENNGYRELALRPDELDDPVLDESLILELDSSQDPVVINLQSYVIMDSSQIVRLAKWIEEISDNCRLRLVIFANRFVAGILVGILGGRFSVFSDIQEMEVAVRQEVALEEKDLLWKL